MLSDFMKKYFIKQNMMRTVIISLIPITISSIYFFGWRTLVLLFWVTLFGVGTEWIYEKIQGKKISEAIFVTCILYILTLPPSTPIWIAVVGIVFGVFFGKEVFGGFGRNLFNPALVARAFVYITFPEPLTIKWSEVATAFPGICYIYYRINRCGISGNSMLIFRETGEMVALSRLLLGNVPGSLGKLALF